MSGFDVDQTFFDGAICQGLSLNEEFLRRLLINAFDGLNKLFGDGSNRRQGGLIRLFAPFALAMALDDA